MSAGSHPVRTSQFAWHRNFIAQSPLFEPVRGLVEELAVKHPDAWPGLDDYQRLLDHTTGGLHSRHGPPIHFVDQDKRAQGFENGYEPRIYLRGEIQTRRQNWHDFFQLLIWCQFPQSKSLLNALHYHAARGRLTANPVLHNRSPLENAITLFDECGVIIVSSNPLLLQLIRNMQWQELFWQHREILDSSLHCIVFGHALYEKALRPYPGLTGNAILIETDASFHQLGQRQQWHWLDCHISQVIESGSNNISTRCFYPFPVLGMPGWDSNNRHPDYYANSDYFRSSRRKA